MLQKKDSRQLREPMLTLPAEERGGRARLRPVRYDERPHPMTLEKDRLEDPEVLPGFAVEVADLF